MQLLVELYPGPVSFSWTWGMQ